MAVGVLEKQSEDKHNEAKNVEQARQSQRRTYSPAVDIFDRAEHIELVADLPGVKEQDVQVTVEGSLLTIEGQSQATGPQSTALYREFGFGDFYRRFEIGSQLDASGIEATMKHGQLKLRLPKAEPKQTRIEVRAG